VTKKEKKKKKKQELKEKEAIFPPENKKKKQKAQGANVHRQGASSNMPETNRRRIGLGQAARVSSACLSDVQLWAKLERQLARHGTHLGAIHPGADWRAVFTEVGFTALQSGRLLLLREQRMS
jgi:hypothetical protein